MAGARQWAVAAIAGVGVSIGTLVGAGILFSAYLADVTRIAPFETPDGTLIAPSPFGFPLSYALTCAVLAILATAVLVTVGIGVVRVKPGATAPALVAVSFGPLAALMVEVVGSIYGFTQDPPEASVGTIVGIRPVDALAWAVVYLLPVAIAWVVLLARQRRTRRVASQEGLPNKRIERTP